MADLITRLLFMGRHPLNSCKRSFVFLSTTMKSDILYLFSSLDFFLIEKFWGPKSKQAKPLGSRHINCGELRVFVCTSDQWKVNMSTKNPLILRNVMNFVISKTWHFSFMKFSLLRVLDTHLNKILRTAEIMLKFTSRTVGP